MQQKHTICLAMLVRNESAIIRRSLLSVRPLISHWVIFDTGADPELKSVIQHTLAPVPGELYQQPFSDFSDLRNRLLDIARRHADFILMIDADEILIEPGELVSEMSGRTIGNIAVGNEKFMHFMPRFFSSKVAGHYTGMVYERFVEDHSDSSVNLLSTTLFHAQNGYRYSQPQILEHDQIKLQMTASRTNATGLDVFNLARLCIRQNKTAEAVNHLELALNRGLPELHRWYSYYLLGLLAIEQNAPLEKIVPHFARAYDDRPDKLEPLHQLIRLYIGSEELEQAYALSCVATEDFAYDKSLYYEPAVHDYESIIQHAELCQKMGKDEEARDTVEKAKLLGTLSLVAKRTLDRISTQLKVKLPRTNNSSPYRKKSDIVLTIGMATYDDFDGVFFTVQSIFSYLGKELDVNYEFLIIDNNPRGESAEVLKQFARFMPRTRYVAYDHIQGTAAAKNQVFVHARGEIVICLDSHILLMPGSIRALLEYYARYPESGNLLQGASLANDHGRYYNFMTADWNNGFFGEWQIDGSSSEALGEDIEIEIQGLGAFACRKSAWPGFNARLRGYGGEEGVIQKAFSRLNRKTINLAGFVWLHRFARAGEVSYDNLWEDRIRNFSIGFDEVGVEHTDLSEHYITLLGESLAVPLIAGVKEEMASPLHYFNLIYILSPIDIKNDEECLKIPPALVNAHPVIVHPGSLPPVPVENKLKAHAALLNLACASGLKNILIVDDAESFSDELVRILSKSIQELSNRNWRRCYIGANRLSGQFEPVDHSGVLYKPDGMIDAIATAYASNSFESLAAEYDLQYADQDFAIPSINDFSFPCLNARSIFSSHMITYQGDVQRMRNFESMNDGLSGMLEMYPAVDAIKADFEVLCQNGIEEGIFTAAYVDELKYNISGEVPRTPEGNIPVGKVGCKMSHFRLLKWLFQNRPDTEWFLIMEDDCVLECTPQDILLTLGDFCKHASRLGSAYVRLCVYPEFVNAQFDESLSLGHGFYTAIPQWGTCAYLISRGGIHYVLGDLPTDLNTDNYFSSRLKQLKAVTVRSPFITIGEYLPPNIDRPMGVDAGLEKSSSASRCASLIWQN